MTVDPRVTLAIVQAELARARRLGQSFGWEFSPLNEAIPSFTVKMKSLVDGEVYVVELQLDNYKEWPPYTDFVNPLTGERGTKRCYPRDGHPEGGSLFHETPCICHPSCRKAYGKYRGPHGDWDGQITNWQAISGNIRSIPDILLQIQARINDRNSYRGRMEK